MSLALVIGGSGAVGSQIIAALLDSPKFSSIILVNRTRLYTDPANVPSKITECIVDMPQTSAGIDDFQKATAAALAVHKTSKQQAVFIAMGVGAPSKSSSDQLELVDVLIPSAFATAVCATATVKHISLLTAVNANAASDAKLPEPGFLNTLGMPTTGAGGPLYNFQKGRVERNMTSLPVSSCAFFRPGALVGSPNTPGWLEAILPTLDWILPAKFASSDVRKLGRAMVEHAEKELEEEDEEGATRTVVLEGARLQECYEGMV